MTMALALDTGLALLLLGLAAWTIGARDSFAAVIGFVVYGLLLSLVWVRLWAVDVALTEAAVGSGVTGMLLIGAAARLRDAEASGGEASLSLRLVAGALRPGVGGSCGTRAVSARVKPTLAPQVWLTLQKAGLGNPVTGVLLAYRSFDTLLEKVVLILALVGVWSLAPDRLWGGIPGLRHFTQPGTRTGFPCPGCCRRSASWRHLHVLGRCKRAGRRLPGRRNPRRHVAARHDRRTQGRPRSAAGGYG